MTEHIDLPPLPECLLNLPLETLHEIQSHTYHAIKADRQQLGEPVGYVELAAFEWLTNPERTAEAQIVTAIHSTAKAGEGFEPIYSAPQPAEPVCKTCGGTKVDPGGLPVCRTCGRQHTTPATTFKLGDHVRKTKGSNWRGHVVGTYSTALTPEGYAVESDTETGSVQIYPAHALELVS